MKGIVATSLIARTQNASAPSGMSAVLVSSLTSRHLLGLLEQTVR
jgi:hypothetical protein